MASLSGLGPPRDIRSTISLWTQVSAPPTLQKVAAFLPVDVQYLLSQASS